VEICGQRQDRSRPEWKAAIGYVGDQQVFYENWSGERNLAFLSQFYSGWSDQRAVELARRFNLPLNKMAKELSTGNRVKLSLVAALSHSPQVLLLDEPTSGLDPIARSELLEVLFEFMSDGERAILYSTHILADISRLADELAFLDDGKIKARQATEDLAENWRRICFRSAGSDLKLAAVASHRHEGRDYEVVSFDREITLRQLGELGAENIQEQRMGIDEIAVQILKGGGNVADSEN